MCNLLVYERGINRHFTRSVLKFNKILYKASGPGLTHSVYITHSISYFQHQVSQSKCIE